MSTTETPRQRVLVTDPPPAKPARKRGRKPRTDPKETTVAAAAADADAPAGKSKKKLVVIVALVVLLGAGAYYFLVASKSGAKPVEKGGAVVAMEAMTLNLADGHYLKLQLGLQTVEGTDVKTVDPAQAADLAIATYSNKPEADMASDQQREALKKTYLAALRKAYPDEIHDVFYTTFVMQ